jgi:hypothetical protein
MNSKDIEEKQCKECLEWFEMNGGNFGINRGNKDGFNELCKKCQKEINHRNYINNREDRLRKSNEYKKDHKELYQIYNRIHHQEQKERLNARTKTWHDKNREYVSEWIKDWRKTEHGRTIANMHSRNRQQNKTHKISKKEYENCKDYFDDSCAYCGMPEELHKELFNQQLHKDHADPNGSNDLSNCIPSCKICNSEKHDSKWDEWYTPNNKHYEEEKYNKIEQWLNEEYKKYIKIRPNK